MMLSKSIQTAIKLILFIFFLCNYQLSQAHPIEHTTIELDIRPDSVIANIQIPMSDLQMALNEKLRGLSLAELDLKQNLIKNYIIENIDITDSNNQSWQKTINEKIEFNDLDKRIPDVGLTLTFKPQQKVELKFNLTAKFITPVKNDHKIFVGIKSDWENGQFSDNKKLAMVLNNKITSVEISREGASTIKGLMSTLQLGIRHIYEGLDHMAFLILLILSISTSIFDRNKKTIIENFKQTFYLVSAFTLGHSLTLFIGGLNLISISSLIVEPLVALTILFTAIHNLKPIITKNEWVISLGFGLIHGFAFSEVVKEMNLPLKQWLLSVFSFNIGVEIMQIIILLFCLPILWFISQNKNYLILKKIISITGILLAFYWLAVSLAPAFNNASLII